ncbi:MAG: TonB-dependent receptor [Candidatus Aureabacteria bacterium]|nr:TonB-dependent receptor [Candidatus Auribacterota bacterium]
MSLRQLLTQFSALALVLQIFSLNAQVEQTGFEYLLYSEIPVVSTPSKSKEKLSDAPSVVSVITKKEIRLYGGNNLRDLFDRVPSMQTLGTQMQPESSVSIRGQSFFQINNHVLFLINGRPFRENLNQGYIATLLEGFPLEMIERIEIIRGPGSVLYGSSAFSGVVNIITKTRVDNPDTFSARAMAGNFGTSDYGLNVSTGSEDWELNVAGRYWDSDGWNLNYTDQTKTRYDFPIDELNYGAFLDARFHNFRINVFHAQIEQDAFQPTGLGPLRRHINRHSFIDMSYDIEISENWKIENHATYNDFEFGDIDLFAEGILIEATLIGKFNDRTSLLWGVTYANEDFDSPANWIQNAVYTSEQPISSYVQLDYWLNDKYKLVGGLQYNKPVDTEDGISPRIALIGNLNETWGFKLMHGEAYRSPNFIESYVDSPGILYGNRNLNPETINTTEAQLNFNSAKANVSVTYYHSTIKDTIMRYGFPIHYYNGGLLGNVEFDGFEIEGRYFLGNHFVIQGNSLIQSNETEYGLENVSFTPGFMAKLGISYSSERGYTIGLFDSYFGEPTDSQDLVPSLVSSILEVNPEPEAFHLMSLNADFNLTRLFNWSETSMVLLSIFADNLLDEDIHYPDLNAQHTNSYTIHSPRAVYMTLKVKY